MLLGQEYILYRSLRTISSNTGKDHDEWDERQVYCKGLEIPRVERWQILFLVFERGTCFKREEICVQNDQGKGRY